MFLTFSDFLGTIKGRRGDPPQPSASVKSPHVKASDIMTILLLVGGLEHEFYFPIYWVSNHPN